MAMLAICEALQTGETELLRVRPHRVVFLRAAIWAAIALALAGAALLDAEPQLWTLASLLFAGGAIAAAAEAALRRATTTLIVTDRRVMLRTGLFRRRLAEAYPGAVSGLDIAQGPLGRALDVGRVRVRGLGEPAPWIPLAQPALIRHRVEELALAPPHASPERASPEPAPQAAAPAHLSLVENASTRLRKPNGGARPAPDVRPAAVLKPSAERDRI